MVQMATVGVGLRKDPLTVWSATRFRRGGGFCFLFGRGRGQNRGVTFRLLLARRVNDCRIVLGLFLRGRIDSRGFLLTRSEERNTR